MSWPHMRLDACAQIVSGATPSTNEPKFWDGDICWATPKDLSELDGRYIDDTPRKITNSGLIGCSAEILPPGSVLFSSSITAGFQMDCTFPSVIRSFIPRYFYLTGSPC